MKRPLLVLVCFIISFSNAFLVPAYERGSSFGVVLDRHTGPPKLQMLPDTGSLLTAVEVFDGSSIVDPVVVSNVFWTSLKTKIIAVIIGQILAAIAFALLSSLVASQISQMGTFVSQILQTPASPSKNSGKTFIKATDMNNNSSSSNSSNVTPDFGKLLFCLAIDVVGSSSEIIPFVGEFTDVIYAPIAATLLRSLYGGSNVIFALEFAEEILPFTDILPLATLCWVVDTYFGDSDLAKVLQLGNYGPTSSNASSDVIDTKADSMDNTQILPERSSRER